MAKKPITTETLKCDEATRKQICRTPKCAKRRR